VVLEAFREGTPVVVRELGPYPQIIEESGGGLMFRDAEGLRAALARLADDGGLRARLGERGRRAVETLWSEETAVGAYLDLVRRTAMSRSRPDISAKVDALTPSFAGADGTSAQ
jgi:glycosyltransferase involved in cell wall biosynthesis